MSLLLSLAPFLQTLIKYAHQLDCRNIVNTKCPKKCRDRRIPLRSMSELRKITFTSGRLIKTRGCSAYLSLACFGLFPFTEYYLFYQLYTIHAVSRTGRSTGTPRVRTSVTMRGSGFGSRILHFHSLSWLRTESERLAGGLLLPAPAGASPFCLLISCTHVQSNAYLGSRQPPRRTG